MKLINWVRYPVIVERLIEFGLKASLPLPHLVFIFLLPRDHLSLVFGPAALITRIVTILALRLMSLDMVISAGSLV